MDVALIQTSLQWVKLHFDQLFCDEWCYKWFANDFGEDNSLIAYDE